jgi:hypothetical protein
MVAQRVEEIKYVRENGIPATQEITNQWQELLAEETIQFCKQSTSRSQVILEASEWDQIWPYNNECPSCIPGQYCPPANNGCTLVGCSGVAMGQIMDYHEYPPSGLGDTSYTCPSGQINADFEHAEYKWHLYQFTDWSNTAGAKALFHCSASIGTNFGNTKSSAPIQNIPYALINHFRYAPTAKFVEKWQYSSSAWKNLLRNEIDEGRPMVYRGESDESGGHAFVCQGYRTEPDQFYFNWGWEGDANGWYTLDDLNPNGRDYTNQQKAVIGILPLYIADFPYSTGFADSLDQYWFTESSTSVGRIEVTGAYSPYQGTRHLIMDVSQNGTYNNNYAILSIDLSNSVNPVLSFYWKEFNDESHNQDGVYFSEDGISFTKVFSLTENNNAWEPVELNIKQLADSLSLKLTEFFAIKFQQYDNLFNYE